MLRNRGFNDYEDLLCYFLGYGKAYILTSNFEDFVSFSVDLLCTWRVAAPFPPWIISVSLEIRVQGKVTNTYRRSSESLTFQNIVFQADGARIIVVQHGKIRKSAAMILDKVKCL